MKNKIFKIALLWSTFLLTEDSFASENFRFQSFESEKKELLIESPDPRDLMVKFKTDILPKINLEDKTAAEAVEKLGEIGFQCALRNEGAKKLLNPSEKIPPHVECQYSIGEKQHTIWQLLVFLSMADWKGDGTPLFMRYDQLFTSKVNNIGVSIVSSENNKNSLSSKKESVNLDRDLIIAKHGQSLSEVTKYTMLHDIFCRVDSQNSVLKCSALRPSSGCLSADISINFIGQKNSMDASSLLLGNSKLFVDKQESWSCIATVEKSY